MDHADFLPKQPIHKLVILTKYHNDRVKIGDLFQRDSFWASPIFYYPYFRCDGIFFRGVKIIKIFVSGVSRDARVEVGVKSDYV